MKKSEAKAFDYADRINRAINFILRNLAQPIHLEAVARAACFSPFHFHRLFRLQMGESLNDFVKRLRLEHALGLMSRPHRTSRPSLSLTEVAFASGFASSSDFARCFKQRYGFPPSRFDLQSFRDTRREEWQLAVSDPATRNRLDRLQCGANPDGFTVQIRRLPARSVAYLRVLNSFRPGAVTETAARLVRWAEARGLAGGQWLGYMWDDPEITAHELCRYDIGLVLQDPLTSSDEVSQLRFAAMEVAEVEIRGPIELELRALDWLYQTWLPASGFVPADEPCFEAWMGLPFAHGTEHFELRLQLPVTRN